MFGFKKVVIENYANFSGRARREEFWMFIVLLIILYNAVGLAAFLLAALISPLIILIWLLMVLALFIPTLAVTVRRLHDSGRTGWWLLCHFAPFVLAIAVPVLANMNINPSEFSSVLFLVALVLLGSITFIPLVFLILDSQTGTNKWGPNPKEELAHQTTPPPL